METDIGSYLKTYNGIKEGTPRILNVLKRHGVEATFLFTGEAALKNPDQVVAVSKAGHEVGCHSLKHETVGDVGFNMPNDAPILEEEMQHRLEKNVEIVEGISGKRPVSFRAPRLWQGGTQLKVLEQAGFKVDASYSVSAHKKRIIPYHPSLDNWLEEGSMKILEIPNFAFLDQKNDYSKFFCGNDQWPLLRLLGAEFVFEYAQYFLAEQKKLSNVCVLLFYLHPWEFEEMPERFQYDEGVFIFKPELHKNCGQSMTAEFDKYIKMCLNDGFKFTTLERFFDLWNGK